MRFFALIIGLVFVGSTGFAQHSSPWEMVSPPVFELGNIVIAKTKDANTVSMMLPQWNLETRTRTVAVTKQRTETRVREVDVDGQAVSQEYVVEVPYTEQIEQAYTVQVLGGKARKDFPVGELMAWDLNGNKLSSQQLLQKLQAPTHVYRLPHDRPLDISAYHAAVLNRNLIFVYHPEA